VDFFTGLGPAIDAMQSWTFVLAFVLGCLNGMLTGLLPGLGGSVGIALMIPFTYGMDTHSAMALFVAALAGQSFCGSVTAILLNVPGASPSAATTLDGYPLARQGRGGFALGISAAASSLGSLIGTICLIALIPLVRPIVLAFSFPEFTMLGLLGLTIIAMASRGSLLKGIVAGLVGVLLSFIGFAPIGGDVRYAFNEPSLFAGLDVVIVLVGMFSVTEALQLLRTNQSVAQDISQARFGRRQVWEGVVYTVKQPWLLIRSSLLGAGVGLVPAVGGTVAAFLAYFQAAKTVKNPYFGRGDPRGVLAPEASNDAKDSGSALPSLAFGIPGSSDWAVVMGAMVIHGITPGPNLIRESPDIIWIAIIILIAASFFTSSMGLIFGPQLLHITRVRPGILAPIVLVLAVVGAFALNFSITDVIVSIVFGLVAYAMRSINMPLIPVILGFILGPLVERSFLQTISSYGGPSGFVTRPIALVLLILIVLVLVFEFRSSRRSRTREPEALERGVHSATRPTSLVVMSGFGLLATVAIVLATDFTFEGAQFPLMTAGLLLLLVVVYLAIALVPSLRRRFGGVISDGGSMEELTTQMQHEAVDLVENQPGSPPVIPGSADTEASPAATGPAHAATVLAQVEEDAPADPEDRRRLLVSLGLVLAMLLGSVLVGVALTVPVLLVLFLRLVTRESWRTTVLTAVLTSAAFYLVFVQVLGVPVEGGSLLQF
jgi:TctA family transporter